MLVKKVLYRFLSYRQLCDKEQWLPCGVAVRLIREQFVPAVVLRCEERLPSHKQYRMLCGKHLVDTYLLVECEYMDFYCGSDTQKSISKCCVESTLPGFYLEL